MDMGGIEKEMESKGEVGHLRSLRREDLRWQRRDVIIVVSCLVRIHGSVIVRRLVL
jgi:hypothetical protein